MKNIYISLIILLITSSIQAQSFIKTWQGPQNEIPIPNGMGINFGSSNAQDYDYDKVADFLMSSPDDQYIIVVNGKNSFYRDSLFNNVSRSLCNNENYALEAYYLNLTNSTSDHKDVLLGIDRNGSFVGLDSSQEMKWNNGLITFPCSHKLISIRDFDKDGKMEFLFENVPNLSVEIWELE